jgi:hypothetical protein
MRETKPAFWVFLMLLVLPVFADVKTGHDEKVDFGSYRTYSWREGTPAVNPEVQEWIVGAIDRELQAKGLSRVDDKADIHVSTVAYGELDIAMRGNYVRLNRYDTYGVITSHVVDQTIGNLIVDLIDPASDEPVWRGVAQEEFNSTKIHKAQKKIEKIVKKMFKDFPPS